MILFIMNILIPIDFAAKFSLHSKLIELGILVLEVAVGGITYFSVILLMKVPEGKYLIELFFNRFKAFTLKLKK